MKKISPANEKLSRIVYSVLLSIAGLLILILIIGTIIGLSRSGNADPFIGSGYIPAEPDSFNDDIRVFSEMGRLRIPLVDSSTLVISIAFPYSANDVTFSEELAAKIDDFKSIVISYFSSLPAANLAPIDEERAKHEILRRFNNNLRLGSLQTLYFIDVTVISPAGF